MKGELHANPEMGHKKKKGYKLKDLKKHVAFIILLSFFVLPWSLLAQTQHSITVAVINYVQGSGDQATGINFYRATSSGGPYVKLNATPVVISPAVTQLIDTTGIGGTKYFYVATAVDAKGFESPFSAEVNATFLDNPATPPAATLTVK